MIKPLGEFILIKQSLEDEKNEAGVYSAHSVGEKTEAIAVKGIIVSLGGDAKCEAKTDDKVLVAKWEAQKANVGGINYLLAKSEHILAILK